MLATKSSTVTHAQVGNCKPEPSRKMSDSRYPIDAARVTECLNSLGLGPVRVAKEARLQRTYISDILEGRKRSVNGRERLERLARALGVTPAYLTGVKAVQPRLKPADNGSLCLQGTIAEGVSRRTPDAGRYPTVAVQPDPRYLGEQGVFAVTGGDLASIGAPAGSWLLAVQASDFLRVTHGYRPGQLVICSLVDGTGEEVVVRRVITFPDRVELHPVTGEGTAYTLGRHPRGRRLSVKAVVLKAIHELA